jgi:3D (Asp-Asp-Asp) domain-containing protein
MPMLMTLMMASFLAAGEWVPIQVEATGYCTCTICCGVRAAGITADGTRASEYPYGIAVAFPKQIPYGTPIRVPHGQGYLDQQSPHHRYWYADDTGGRLKREQERTGITRIDLRFVQHRSAVLFGRRRITIEVWKE